MAYRYRRSRRSRTDTSFSTPAIVSLAIVSLVVVFGGYLSEQLTPQVLLITVGCLSFILIVTAWWLKQWWANLQLQRLKNLALNDIDQMSGVEFEKYVAKLLKAQGFYKVDLTPVGSDFGVDVTAWRENLKYAIQVKRYKGLVGVDALYQVIGGKAYYDCDRTIVVTNSHFSPAAWELTKKTHTWLVDREKLSEWLVAFKTSAINH